jgi:hypothetical protein
MLINNATMSTMQVQKKTINVPMYIHIYVYIYMVHRMYRRDKARKRGGINDGRGEQPFFNTHIFGSSTHSHECRMRRKQRRRPSSKS